MKLKRIACMAVALAMGVQLLAVGAFAADDTEGLTPEATPSATAETAQEPTEEETAYNEAATFDSTLPEDVNEALGISVMMFTAPDYAIATADDLKAFADAVNGGDTFSGKTVKLTADIDLSSVCSATAGSWTPIGTASKIFEGTFDGQNHTISNLYINSSDIKNVGLFGYCRGTIENLGVVNANISSSYSLANVGAIAGWLCTVDSVESADDFTAHLENCYATGTIEATGTGSNCAGGLVGKAQRGTIKNSYSTAAVTATGGSSRSGGVVGYLEDATLDTCYSTGAVSGSTTSGAYTGGVVGYAGKDYFPVASTSIKNCVALNPSVSGAADTSGWLGKTVNTGAVVGYYFSATTATVSGNSYWGSMEVKKNGTTATDKDQSSSTALTYDASTAKLKAGAADYTWSAFPDAAWENKTAGTVPTLKGISGQSSLLPAHIKPRVTVTITDLDLTSLLAVPAKNGTPQTTVTDTQYTGTVAWSPAATSFAGETLYTATVTLTPKEGYKLEGLAANAFTHTGATSVSNAANGGTVTLVFPATAARTLTGIAVSKGPTKTAYTYGDAFAPAGLELTLTYDDGTDTVAYTAANAANFTFAPTVLTVGTTAVTVNYGGRSASISGITVAKKPLTWDVSDLSAIKPYDGTTKANVTGTLKVSGMVNGEDAQFTYESLSGTYGIEDAGSDRNVNVTVTNPTLGNTNYALPTTGVSFLGTIARPLPVPSIPDGSNLKLTVMPDITVPAALKTSTDYNTPEKITAAMKQKAKRLLPGVSDANILTVDITLWQKDGTATDWAAATQVASYTPGVTITVLYEEFGLTAATAKGMNFIIAHMVSSGTTAGTIESLPYTLTADGLQFTMTSFSPVTFAFKAKSVAPAPEPTVTATPAPVSAPGKFTVNAWVNVLAGGVVSPMGNTNHMQGENLTYTITPAAGYRIARITVDGVDVGAVSSYTFYNLNRSHQIGAYFEKTTVNGKIPATADEAPLLACLALMLLAALGLGATVTLRRKNRK